MDKQQPSRNNEKKAMSSWLVYTGMAFELFGIIGVFAAIGYFLDKQFSTQPFLLILLLLIGTAGAFYRIYKSTISK
ncbi:MAG: AtpZ/AtpI family protein [Chitinophagales bacterium]